MKFRQWLFSLILLFAIFIPTNALRKGYMLRKGSRLEYDHKRILHGWRKAYKHHKPRHADKYEDLLSKMDSMVRPRFG